MTTLLQLDGEQLPQHITIGTCAWCSAPEGDALMFVPAIDDWLCRICCEPDDVADYQTYMGEVGEADYRPPAYADDIEVPCIVCGKPSMDPQCPRCEHEGRVA